MRFPAVIALIWAVGLVVPAAGAGLESGSLDVRWNTGAPDCHLSSAPPLQVHRYNDQTYILRESLCVTRQAPFMYLLIGSKRALLIDTGAVTDPSVVPLARTVLNLLPGSGPTKLPLLVVHTHGHSDHRGGDAQFQSSANVQVVGTDLDQVQQYFGFKDWPNGSAAVDLGDTQVDVLPTPGHDKVEVSYYDRRTGLFFSGDFFQPGRLLIADGKADLASAQRMADFVRFHSIAYVLGGHIELDADGHGFGWLGSHYHPNEHVLQMPYDALTALPVIVGQFNGFYTRYGMFVMMNYTLVLGAIVLALVIVLAVVVLGIRRVVIRRRENSV